jgi:hypothetical protein
MFNQRTFNLHQLSSVHDDPETVEARFQQSSEVGEYGSYNFYNHRNIQSSVNTATEEKAVPFRDGYGVNQHNIDTDSELRINQHQTNPRTRLNVNLNQRMFLSVPYMGRGRGDQFLESELQQSRFVREKAYAGNNISEQQFENVFIPQIKHLQKNIQNPRNLVQEVADPTWVRGGIPSRLVIRDNSEDCKYN